jgi:hypothetical protein
VRKHGLPTNELEEYEVMSQVAVSKKNLHHQAIASRLFTYFSKNHVKINRSGSFLSNRVRDSISSAKPSKMTRNGTIY